jgi:hypothetical protein
MRRECLKFLHASTQKIKKVRAIFLRDLDLPKAPAVEPGGRGDLLPATPFR